MRKGISSVKFLKVLEGIKAKGRNKISFKYYDHIRIYSLGVYFQRRVRKGDLIQHPKEWASYRRGEI